MQNSLNNIVFDLYAEAQTDLASGFAINALNRVKRAIPFDSAGNTTFTFSDDGQAFITGFAALNVSPNKGELRAELVGLETFSKKTGICSRDPLLTSSVRHPGRTHSFASKDIQDKRIAEYARRTESANALCYVTPIDKNQFATMSFWRAGSTEFTAEQRAVSDLLIPHVLQALAINRKLVSSVLLGNLDQCGVIIAEAGGTIHFIDDISVILLRREFPGWLSYILPAEIIAGFKSSSVQQYIGRHAMLQLRRQDRLMVISIKTRDAGSKLTPAEVRVVGEIVRYGNYKEVARQLDVSVSTVRNQLHSIYRKLGIQSKSELVKSFSNRN